VAKLKRLASIGSRISTIGSRTPKQPKLVDPYYLTPEHRAWRETIIARAGRRCEWIEHGQRCTKAEPRHRMFADHIVERRDGGDPKGEGMCLCGSHHGAKTAAERMKRQTGMGV
jgi:5-methylcytosine-specific restriction protein A